MKGATMAKNHTTTCQDCVPVGATEIADMLDVKRQTVNQWAYRGVLPEPRWTVHGYPAWNRDDIVLWAELTGRTKKD